ncbi:hypothetical protein RCO48_28460 [Peribacillus frigoritolerans]|nr:hypothetical protein [Peribacillus frigoritolerans]
MTGLLIGMSALAVPGIGPILAAGPDFRHFWGKRQPGQHLEQAD